MRRIFLTLLFLAAALCAAACSPTPTAPTPTAPTPAAPTAPAATPAPAAPTPAAQPTPTPAAPTPAAHEPDTWVWLSDTQYYVESYPEHFMDMCRYIAANAGNISRVVHTGDLINDEGDEKQWLIAKEGLDVLGDAGANIFLVPGNHDVAGDKQRYKSWRTVFGADAYKGYADFGGDYNNGMGRYDLIDIDGVPAIIAYLGWKSSDEEALNWLDGVLKQYKERFAVLCFHGYMRTDGELLGEGEKYLTVIEQNANVKLVLCGHKHGVYRQMRTFDDDKDDRPDRVVWELISDYQSEPEGGMGYLSLMRFDMKKGELSITAYSPLEDDYNWFDAATGLETFVLHLDMD